MPNTVGDTLAVLNKLNPHSYTAVLEAQKIIAVVPSASCSCEQPVSSSRRLKDYTQSIMKSDRFNGLTFMYTLRDIFINPSPVQKNFSWPTLIEEPSLGLLLYICCCIFYSVSSSFLFLLFGKRSKVFQALICLNFIQFCYLVKCCHFSANHSLPFLSFCCSVAWNESLSSSNVIISFMYFYLQQNIQSANTILCVFAF